MSWLRTLGLRLDTLGWKARQRSFRTGWPSQTSSEIKFFDTPKVQYRYRERSSQISDAQTLVLTADPPVTLEVYDELLDVFSKRFRVVIVELPGMGFSATRGNYRFGFRETNDDLALFLRAVAGKQAIWAFSCVAGLAAIDLAARQPELVSDLVTLQVGDVAAFARWKAARDPKGILGRPVVGQFLMSRMAPKRMPDWYKVSVGNTDKIEHFCDCARQSFEHGALWSLASAYQVYMDPGVTLAPVDRPVLSLWGRADRSHPVENEKSSSSFSDTVEHVGFEDLGHFSELEDPARVFRVVNAYLNG
ncbi:MAG: alpha/beta hydrolase [Pseudomonadota bacterium]